MEKVITKRIPVSFIGLQWVRIIVLWILLQLSDNNQLRF